MLNNKYRDNLVDFGLNNGRFKYRPKISLVGETTSPIAASSPYSPSGHTTPAILLNSCEARAHVSPTFSRCSQNSETSFWSIWSPHSTSKYFTMSYGSCKGSLASPRVPFGRLTATVIYDGSLPQNGWKVKVSLQHSQCCFLPKKSQTKQKRLKRIKMI